MTRSGQGSASLKRLELIEKESHLRKELNDMKIRRQNLISEIKLKRPMATEIKGKRDSSNEEVKLLIGQAKDHLKKRDEINAKIRNMKEERTGITKEIQPLAQKIRTEKDKRQQLNRKARSSTDELVNEFEASLKTLFEMELSSREEVIMVEMVMDLQKRYQARKGADNMSTDIHKTWENIKGIEEQASHYTVQIMELASNGEKEHQAAMELFDKKNEVNAQGQEYHANYIAMLKEIKSMSHEIDVLSKGIDERFYQLRPLSKRLDGLRITRREEQKLEQLKSAKNKMETTGKLGLEDLRVLIESRALDFGGPGKNSTKGKQNQTNKKPHTGSGE